LCRVEEVVVMAISRDTKEDKPGGLMVVSSAFAEHAWYLVLNTALQNPIQTSWTDFRGEKPTVNKYNGLPFTHLIVWEDWANSLQSTELECRGHLLFANNVRNAGRPFATGLGRGKKLSLH